MSTILTPGFSQNDCGIQVMDPPDGYQPFYSKYALSNGIPIISSLKVPDNTFCIAYDIVYNMTANLSPVVLHNIIANGGKLAIMAQSEVTTDVPEHSNLYQQFPGSDWDRYRGLGGTLNIPVTTCAEENLLCYHDDIYKGENIAVHEFAHGIHNLGLAVTYPDFNTELEELFNSAKSNGLWDNTYAGSNYIEYFAEGVQSWFNCNRQASPTDGVHNHVDTREELKEYDIGLYNLIKKHFDTEWEPTCNPSDVDIISSISEEEKSGIKIYPNPCNKTFSIQLGVNSGNGTIKIFTLQGKEIVQKEITSHIEQIDLTGYNTGFYFVSILCGGKIYQQKLISL